MALPSEVCGALHVQFNDAGCQPTPVASVANLVKVTRCKDEKKVYFFDNGLDHRKMNYSDTWLKWTPTGPNKCVRFNQVSALERLCYVSLLENLPKRTQIFCPS